MFEITKIQGNFDVTILDKQRRNLKFLLLETGKYYIEMLRNGKFFLITQVPIDITVLQGINTPFPGALHWP